MPEDLLRSLLAHGRHLQCIRIKRLNALQFADPPSCRAHADGTALLYAVDYHRADRCLGGRAGAAL